MSIMVLIALLAASITTQALISYQISTVTCNIDESGYWAEGAVDRAIWLLRNDRKLHPTRYLGSVDYAGNDDEIERYMADGAEHKLDYYGGKVILSILDAASGKDISGSNPTKYLFMPQTAFGDDNAKWERYKMLMNAIRDYIDLNDFVTLNGGMEAKSYEELGLAPLPRNDKFEYREELLLIPGAEEFFTANKYGIVDSLRIIAPLGLRPIRGKENFFSTSDQNFSSNGNFDQDEYDAIVDARKQWKEDGITLSETLNPDLLTKLKSKYSMRESGFYTVLVKAQPGDNLPGKTLTCTLQVFTNLTSGKDFQFYEWRFLQ
jgi:hypothetical protein